MMVEKSKPIGVFDSGIGGLTILKELLSELPYENFCYFGDNLNAPYGPLPPQKVSEFSKNIVNFLLSLDCKLIVVACNTATAAVISELRNCYDIPIIGVEPAVKPACLFTKTNNIGVLATEGTFKGNHFLTNKKKYEQYVNIHMRVGNDLVKFAEQGVFSGKDVEDAIMNHFAFFKKNNVDYLVLGCTHFPFFNDVFHKLSGDSFVIIDSAEPVARRTKDLLMANRIKEIAPSSGNKTKFYTSGDIKFFNSIISNYLKLDNFDIEQKILP